MKATALLASQHRRVRQLLAALEQERYVRRALLGDLADDLVATLELKEALFYPIVGGALAEEWTDETARARAALRRCLDSAEDEAAFAPALEALKDTVASSFDSEERDLFPRVERGVAAAELEVLGERMLRLYREILEADGDERASTIGRPSRADWYLFEAR
jgi:hypothetical protein